MPSGDFPIDPFFRTHTLRPLRKISLVAFSLLVVSLACYGLAKRQRPGTSYLPNVPITAEQVRFNVEKETPNPVAVPTTQTAADSPTTEPTMRQHVFRLHLDQGRCTLEKMDEVVGAFGRERVMQWQAGMLCCRLLAGDGRIVGERTMPAPDHVCVVLDPNDASGVPVAARLTSGGPSVFQVRFPEIAGAVRLAVYRIGTEARPTDLAAPIGQLLASIPIPTK